MMLNCHFVYLRILYLLMASDFEISFNEVITHSSNSSECKTDYFFTIIYAKNFVIKFSTRDDKIKCCKDIANQPYSYPENNNDLKVRHAFELDDHKFTYSVKDIYYRSKGELVLHFAKGEIKDLTSDHRIIINPNNVTN